MEKKGCYSHGENGGKAPGFSTDYFIGTVWRRTSHVFSEERPSRSRFPKKDNAIHTFEMEFMGECGSFGCLNVFPCDGKGNSHANWVVIPSGERPRIEQNWISAILPPKAARPLLFLFGIPSKKAVPILRNGLSIIHYGDGCQSVNNRSNDRFPPEFLHHMLLLLSGITQRKRDSSLKHHGAQ